MYMLITTDDQDNPIAVPFPTREAAREWEDRTGVEVLALARVVPLGVMRGV